MTTKESLSELERRKSELRIQAESVEGHMCERVTMFIGLRDEELMRDEYREVWACKLEHARREADKFFDDEIERVRAL